MKQTSHVIAVQLLIRFILRPALHIFHIFHIQENKDIFKTSAEWRGKMLTPTCKMDGF